MESGQFPIAATADGSDTFYSDRFGEWFHSRSGAYEEARSIYIQATHLVERAHSQGQITILDVCYGLGYNTAAALEALWGRHPDLPIRLIGLELDETVPRAAIAQGLLKDWPLPVQAALSAIATHHQVVSGSLGPHLKSPSQDWATKYKHLETDRKMRHCPPASPQFWGQIGIPSPPELGDLGGEQTFNDDSQNLCVSGSQGLERDLEPAFDRSQINLAAHLLIGDARQQIQALVEQAFQADVIFLDPFSPPRCPQLWTVEFLSLVARCLHPQGILATYSCAAAVRAALKLAGLQIGSLAAPGRRWPSTLASHMAKNLPPLSQQELEHLATRAAVPYRDPSLLDEAAAIQRRRSQEQAESSLQSTGAWRRRWLA